MSTYLDFAATSIPDPDIIDKTAITAKNIYANPSSIHAEGLKAGELLKKTREICSKVLDIPSANILFTSGGTESNNIAMLSLLRKKKRGKVIISAIEHPSVSEPSKILKEAGFSIIKINPGKDGIVKADSVIKHLDNDVMLVSVMLVNNETGAVQPVEEIASDVKDFARKNNSSIHFHCDAVQGAGKISFNPSDINIDSFSVSSHKFSGPRGAGLLILNSRILPLLSGGGQESGFRPGTENLPAIYGQALALEKAFADFDRNYENSRKLSSILFRRIKNIKSAQIIPAEREEYDQRYSPYILNVSIPPVPAEVLARIMSDRGYCISTGSACSSINKKHSETLLSMGINNKTAFSAIRISTGYTTHEDEILSFCDTFEKEIGNLKNI